MNTESHATETNGNDKLSELLSCLAATAGQDPTFCKELLREIESVISIGHRKNQQHHLVAKLAVAATETDAPFHSLLQWLEGIEATINPDTAIRGLLLDPEANASLVPKLIATSLVPSHDAGKGSFASRSLTLTPQFYKDLKKGAGNSDVLNMGVRVWDEADSRLRSVEWCDAWTRFSIDLLSLASKKATAAREELASDYAIRIADADIKCASSLSRFLLFLQTDVSIPNKAAIQKIQDSHVGRFLQKQSARLAGVGDEEERSANKTVEKTAQGPGQMKSSAGVLSTQALRTQDPSSNAIELRVALPQPLLKAVERFCADLQAHILDGPDTPDFTRDSVEKRSDDEETRRKLQTKVESLIERLNSSNEHVARIEREKKLLGDRVRELEIEAAEREKRFAESEGLRIRIQADFEQLQEDYQNLDRRSEQHVGQSRQQLMLDLDTQLREHWEMMSRMIELVIARKRDPELLGKMWNELDHILWDAIGRPGAPVKPASYNPPH